MSEYLKIKDACKVTGLSQYFLRRGCKDGTIPHIRVGETYFINIRALLSMLEDQCEQKKSSHSAK